MTLPSSGALSLSQIQSEFGGSNPIGLNEYYRGGANVPSHGNTTGIPSSGTISVNQFYGKSNTAPGNASNSHTIGMATQISATTVGYNASFNGTLSNNPQSTNLTTGLRMEFRYVQWVTLCSKTQFEFSYKALAGPTDGTGWSSVTTGHNGNLNRSSFTISGGGNSSSFINCLWTGTTTTAPSSSGTQSFIVYA